MKKSHRNTIYCCSIRSNGWSVYFYVIEVSAWGFCAGSVRSCLRSLGFNNKLCRQTLQTLSFVALRCSFEIWQCPNSKSWSLPHPASISYSEPMQKKSNLNGVSTHMIIMLVLQVILYHHLRLPICIAELSIKGIHVMQMLFYIV